MNVIILEGKAPTNGNNSINVSLIKYRCVRPEQPSWTEID